jgi:hypothetical protein
LNLPSSVEFIGEFAFANCLRSSQFNIGLPSSLKTIERRAFQGTVVRNCVIPPSLSFIDVGAFPHPCEFRFSSVTHRVLIPEWLSRLILDPNAVYDSERLPVPRLISDYVIDFNQYHEFPDSKQCLISRNVYGEVRVYAHNETEK